MREICQDPDLAEVLSVERRGPQYVALSVEATNRKTGGGSTAPTFLQMTFTAPSLLPHGASACSTA